MLGWRRAKERGERPSASVGVCRGPDGLALVATAADPSGAHEIVAWDFVRLDDPSEARSALQRFVVRNQLLGCPARIVLAPDDYSLRLVERPPGVPDEELVEATRWLVRDLIEFDVDQAEIAVLTIPADTNRARTPRMFVVAAKREIATSLGEAASAAGLGSTEFEIVETAMLALEACLPDVVAGRAVLRLQEKSSTLTLSFGEQLYLARSLSIDIETISRAVEIAEDPDQAAQRDALQQLDPLLLEIQRSLDYYESEFGLAPASRLTLLSNDRDHHTLVPLLGEALRPLRVEAFELERCFEIDELPSDAVQSMLALAAGASTDHPEWIGDALTPEPLRARRDGFGIASLARIAMVMLLFAGALFGFGSFRLHQERAGLAGIEAQRESLERELEAERARQAARASRADPKAEVEGLRALRDARLSMLRDLKRGSSDSSAPFSGLLLGLARQDLEGVWLERIVLSDGGDAVALEGRTLRGEDVPRFLRRLGDEPGFADRRFRTLAIERTSDGMPGLAFRIGTRDPSDADGGDDR